MEIYSRDNDVFVLTGVTKLRDIAGYDLLFSKPLLRIHNRDHRF